MVHNDPQVEQRVAEALAAHERGWALTPMNGKKPRLKGWQKAARPDEADVRKWAQGGNVGVRTGSASGVVVIDDDTEDQSAATQLNLPETVTAETGGGGRHYYFIAPTDVISNSAGRLAMKVDVRGENGVIVLPGAIHPDSGKTYRWMPGLDPKSVEVAELPESLLKQLREVRERPAVTAKSRAAQSARERLEAACRAVATSAEGARNDALNRAAFSLRGFVAYSLLDRGLVTEKLGAAATQAGLSAEEVLDTVNSGLKADPSRIPAWSDLLADLGLELKRPETGPAPAQDREGRPSILMVDSEAAEIVAEAANALINDPRVLLFNRGGQVVRITEEPPVTVLSMAAPSGTPLIAAPVDLDWLRCQLSSSAVFYRWVERDGVWKPVGCPIAVARAVLAFAAGIRFPSLVAITATPTIRPDGTVLSRPGYDAATGIYYDPRGVLFEEVPDAPSHADAQAALKRLQEPLKDFPFVSPVDLAVAIAAMLTALVRPSLRTAPLFCITAPKMASGKSLLATVVSLFANGRSPAMLSPGSDENEDKKRYLSILRAGTAVVVIDNVERPLKGATLCTLLTSESYSDRVLGKSETLTFPTYVTWLATGNNLTVEGDLSTRILQCRLDPRTERPEERSFDVDLHKFVAENRADLVIAGLTVLRAFIVAGKPKQGIRQFGRFEDWSELVRSALIWVGMADPCMSREGIEAADPEREYLRQLLSTWRGAFNDTPMLARDVIGSARDGSGHESQGDLRQVLDELPTALSGPATGADLGRFLKSRKDRIEGGLSIRLVGQRQGTALWIVQRDGFKAVPDANRAQIEPDLPHAPHLHHGALPSWRDSDDSRGPGGASGEDSGRSTRDCTERMEGEA